MRMQYDEHVWASAPKHGQKDRQSRHSAMQIHFDSFCIDVSMSCQGRLSADRKTCTKIYNLFGVFLHDVSSNVKPRAPARSKEVVTLEAIGAPWQRGTQCPSTVLRHTCLHCPDLNGQDLRGHFALT
jgi:hypothetical protein